MVSSDRRAFIKTLLAGSLCGVGIPGRLLAKEPLQVGSNPVMRLALAAYSFKDHFAFIKGKSQVPHGGREIDLFSFIDYCAELQCGAELTSYFFPPDADQAYFSKIKRHAFLNGVPIVGTAIGNNFTLPRGGKLTQQIADAKSWIKKAAQMGAPHVRFFAGKRKEWEASPEHRTNAISALQECADFASQFGVFVGVENHGDLGANEILEIVEHVKSEWFGINLDSGNFVTSEPYREFERCAPFAVNVQLKTDMKTPEKGVKIPSDLKRFAKILKNANYRGNIVLEYEEETPFKDIPDAMNQLREVL